MTDLSLRSEERGLRLMCGKDPALCSGTPTHLDALRSVWEMFVKQGALNRS